MRNALDVPKGQSQMVAALIRTAFAETDAEPARNEGREVADRLRANAIPGWPP